MSPQTPPLVAEPDADSTRAERLAAALGAATVTSPPRAGLYLSLGPRGLTLCRAGRPPVRLLPDFVHGPQGFRHARLGVRREAIARACGLTRQPGLEVVDATAGLGRDAFVLAALGARVTLLERHRVVAALLADALHRAREHPETVAAASRLELRVDDAVTWLERIATTAPPAVVTLDPMFAPGRRAAAGKSLALLQELVGPPEDPEPLLEAALAAATDRVVVKRHRQAAPLAGQPPDYAITGRSTRFDVYRRR